MNEHAIRDVVIVGGGIACWMAATALARFLPRDETRITVVETNDVDPLDEQGATTPSLSNLYRLIGIDEDGLIAASGGTFRLGSEFADWGTIGGRYFHPLGAAGQDIAGVHFHQLWLRERSRHAVPDLAAWSMAAAAAARGRFARPTRDDRSALRELTYALHIDPALHVDFLRNHAGRMGVVQVAGNFAGVELRPENGHVLAVRLDDGRKVTGELFLDCSGPRSLLLNEALATEFESYAAWLPCDRFVTVPSAPPDSREPEPFTRVTTESAGWRWRVPLRHRTSNGLVYASAYIDDAAAEAELLAKLDAPQLADGRRQLYRPGCSRQQWNRNVVALGSAAGAIEPLEGTGTHLTQAAVERLIALFPDRRFAASESAAFNRYMCERHEDLRDFTILHYATARRDDTPFWRQVRTTLLPDSLQWRLDLFAGKGRLFLDEGELFGVSAWAMVCLGQGFVPSRWEPAADVLDADKVAVAMQDLARRYAATAEQLPRHGDYLRAIAPSPPAVGGADAGRFSFAFAATPFNFAGDPEPLL